MLRRIKNLFAQTGKDVGVFEAIKKAFEKKHFILHIGFGKTGSSSIQATLVENRDLLSEAGILYTTLNATNHNSLRVLFGHKLRGNAEKAEKDANDLIEILKNQAVEYETILLSGEEFNKFSKDQIRQALNMIWSGRRKITALLYVRDPVDHFRSGVQQTMKADTRFPRAEWVSRKPLRAIKRFQAFSDLHVHNFSRDKLVNGDVVADFFDWLEKVTGTTLPYIKTANRNESLTAEQAIFLQELRFNNPVFEDGKRHRVTNLLSNMFKKINSQKLIGTEFTLSDLAAFAVQNNNEEYYSGELQEFYPDLIWQRREFDVDIENLKEYPWSSDPSIKSILASFDETVLNHLSQLYPAPIEGEKRLSKTAYLESVKRYLSANDIDPENKFILKDADRLYNAYKTQIWAST